ncbi:MAG: TonB-dependent receptor [Novosphingobium sp.]
MHRCVFSLACRVAAIVAFPASVWAEDDAGSNDPTGPSNDIVVTAQRLDAARDAIQPSLGANVTTLDREALETQPGGLDRSLKGVLLQTPGVSQDSDSDGDIHIRNEHSNIQYRLNGIAIPASFAGFGAPIDTRIARSIEVITGTLPAQYGLHTNGVISVKTGISKSGLHGDLGFYGGGNATIQPSASLGGSSGRMTFFLSGSYLKNDLGLAAPTPGKDVPHNRTHQWRGFGYASYLLDDSSRITAFGSLSSGRFQIPNTPGQVTEFVLAGVPSFDSTDLDQNQRNQSHFAVFAYQYSGETFDLQIAPYFRFARAHYTPDPAGGLLLFNGADSDLQQTSQAWGFQADASRKIGDAHTLRFGLAFKHDRTRSISINRVFALDAQGEQASDVPIAIPVDQALTGKVWSAYLQDEWRLGEGVTLNLGLRYDSIDATANEDQLSPRANLVWRPGENTTVHLGYSRYFTPPPLELIAGGTLAAFEGTTGAAETLIGDPVRAEREHLFDIGISQKTGDLTLGIDVYYKIKRNLLDLEQLGGSLIQSPFNYDHAKTWGVEFSAEYKRGPFELYLNVARGDQKATRIVSNQFFFEADELDYIASNYIFTDHTQSWTVSGGGSVRLRNRLGRLVASFDAIHGSGLRAGDAAGLIPNGSTQQPYVQFNLGLAQTFGSDTDRGFSLRLDVINLFDSIYLLHDGSGVSANQAEWGPRRTIYAGLRYSF